MGSVNSGPADATVDALKKRFVVLIEQGTYSLVAAAREIDRSPSTVWLWRRDDPAFDAAVVAAYTTADGVRVQLVEDTLFKRLVEGTASPAETIFFLKNRAPHRWRDVQDHRHAGANGGPIQTETVVRQVWKVGRREIAWN